MLLKNDITLSTNVSSASVFSTLFLIVVEVVDVLVVISTSGIHVLKVPISFSSLLRSSFLSSVFPKLFFNVVEVVDVVVSISLSGIHTFKVPGLFNYSGSVTCSSSL